MKDNSKNDFKKMSTQELKEREAQILSLLPSMDHVIHGSLITQMVKCGKPNCRCASGEGHKSLYLSSFYHGQTGMDYVPSTRESWVREGIENYKLLQESLLELAEIHLALFKRRNKE